MTSSKEVSPVVEECCWLQETRANAVFKEADHLLRECCKRLHAAYKTDEKTGQSRNLTTEKYTLLPRSGQDNLKTTAVVVGDSIVQTEVTLKYTKAPTGAYRGTATPEMHWKLQQLQDAGNLCARALQILVKGQKRYESAVRTGGYTTETGRLLLSILGSVKETVKAVSTTLMTPRRKSLLELCNFHPTKTFNPPLPSDVLLSYYVSSTKLVCACYHVTKAATGAQTVTIYQAECQLPYLVETIQLLDQTFASVHDLFSNYSIFANCHS
ncbi:leucine-zipper-containing transcription factor LZF [Aphelenchoides avenae]|nr:leucine-zipper-containing transcription factor LZF [Aphelenchus avenae]